MLLDTIISRHKIQTSVKKVLSNQKKAMIFLFTFFLISPRQKRNMILASSFQQFISEDYSLMLLLLLLLMLLLLLLLMLLLLFCYWCCEGYSNFSLTTCFYTFTFTYWIIFNLNFSLFSGMLLQFFWFGSLSHLLFCCYQSRLKPIGKVDICPWPRILGAPMDRYYCIFKIYVINGPVMIFFILIVLYNKNHLFPKKKNKL